MSDARAKLAAIMAEQEDSPRIISASTFAKSLAPPSYAIDGLIQGGWLYSLTANTGHGKTAVMMRMALCQVTGFLFAGREVEVGAGALLERGQPLVDSGHARLPPRLRPPASWGPRTRAAPPRG